MNYFKEVTIWKIFLQVLRAVAHLHKRGIIHRDIKTLNILLVSEEPSEDGKDATPVAKLADFGVSRARSNNTVMVRTFYGTPLYASPELCDNQPYTEMTDIWSLGVVLYELAALAWYVVSEFRVVYTFECTFSRLS